MTIPYDLHHIGYHGTGVMEVECQIDLGYEKIRFLIVTSEYPLFTGLFHIFLLKYQTYAIIIVWADDISRISSRY